jgi:hypothetical protein
LEYTSIKTWTIERCISFVALNGPLALDIDIDALSV